MAENTSLDFIWKEISKKAEDIISPLSFSTFIKTLEPVELKNRKLVLAASSQLQANTIVNRFADQLKQAVVAADVGVTDFALCVDNKIVYNDEETSAEADSFDSVPLNKRFTFDSFVVGSSNKFVFAAAKSVAENAIAAESTGGFNPLYIYGGTGLGKTHLVQAVANEILAARPSFKVLYTTCEKFLNEFIDTLFSSKNGGSRDKSSRFRSHYRNVDMLIIDDIQFLSNKVAVQEEFFHTFNELFAQNKQIILTSDVPPANIATLEERLRTRFEGGLIADIQPPDIETKIAILKRKAFEKGCVLPLDVLEFLAQRSNSDVRTLEGKLTKVIFASKLHESPINLDLAALALSESIQESGEESEPVKPDTVIAAVCQFYKVNKDDLLGKNKRAELVRARQISCYLMCDILNLPLTAIGKAMGRDHATVIYSRDKIANLMKKNDRIESDVNDIKSIIFKK